MKLAALLLTSCALVSFAADSSAVKKQNWGKADGKDVFLYTLQNKNGVVVTITNYGAIVQAIKTPDKHGKVEDITLGFDTLAEYRSKNDPHFGGIVGRYGNRIDKGSFALDGHQYKLPINNGTNTIHGGFKGFDKQVWDVKDAAPDHVTLHYLSKDGEEGFPGNLDVTVRYSLNDKNELRIDYTLTSDKDTVHNLTNHTYFNLAGQGKGNVLQHVVMINADKITIVKADLIPTGEIIPVAGTPFDFRQPHALGERINVKNAQLEYGKGYDQNFIVNGSGMRLAARVTEPTSGRVLEVLTDQPAVQLYSGNHLEGPIAGKQGKVYGFRDGLCLETQHYPDSPHQPNFPSTRLKAGQTFHSTTIYRFSTLK